MLNDSLMNNSPNLEKTQIPTNKWSDKQIVQCIQLNITQQ